MALARPRGGVAQIGSENGGRAVGHAAVGGKLAPQRRRKIVGPCAVDNDRDHRSVGVTRPKQPDFFVNCGPACRDRRAQHDQSRRGVERRRRRIGQRVTAGKIFAVAKDRAQRLGHRPDRRLAADQVPVEAKSFKPRVQPLGPADIAMAVAQERAVLERQNSIHVLKHRNARLASR
jgi:hypothetical protein